MDALIDKPTEKVETAGDVIRRHRTAHGAHTPTKQRPLSYKVFAAWLSFPEGAEPISHAAIEKWEKGYSMPRAHIIKIGLAYSPAGSWQLDFWRDLARVLYPELLALHYATPAG